MVPGRSVALLVTMTAMQPAAATAAAAVTVGLSPSLETDGELAAEGARTITLGAANSCDGFGDVGDSFSGDGGGDGSTNPDSALDGVVSAYGGGQPTEKTRQGLPVGRAAGTPQDRMLMTGSPPTIATTQLLIYSLSSANIVNAGGAMVAAVMLAIMIASTATGAAA